MQWEIKGWSKTDQQEKLKNLFLVFIANVCLLEKK